MDLLIDIPATPDDSFHHAQVCIGLKDLALEPSSTLRHVAELSKVCSAWVQPPARMVLFIFIAGWLSKKTKKPLKR